MIILKTSMTKKLILTAILFVSFFGLTAKEVGAVCPVCTVAVGAGLGLSRYLGISDSISGLWVGGLILSSSFWFVDWISKKSFRISRKPLTFGTIFLMYALILIPLWKTEIIGHPFNTISGIDKLVFGIIFGSAIFLTALWFDKFVRKARGHQLLVYQKVAFPVAGLIFASVIFFFAKL